MFLTWAWMLSLLFYLLQLCCEDCPEQWRVSLVGNVHEEEENDLSKLKNNRKKREHCSSSQLFTECLHITDLFEQVSLQKEQNP